MVWWAKCRHRIVGEHGSARCGELREQIAAERCGEIASHEVVLPDRVDLFVEFGPTYSLAAAVWPSSGLAAAVGYVSESTVRQYVERRWDAGAL